MYFLTSVLSVNKPYSSLSQEASPHIKHSAVSWQPARYFILLEASGLIIMVFNLKHGRCPEWLPLRPCTAVRSGLKQPKVSGAVWFLYNVNSWRKKNPMRKEQVLAETPNKTIYTQPGTSPQILLSWELIKKVTSHKGEHKQFFIPFARLLVPFLPSMCLFSLCTQAHPLTG